MKLYFYSILVILLFSITPKTAFSQCSNINDYKALRGLYLSTNGDNWKNRTGWPSYADFLANPTPTSNTNMDNWYGVECVNFRVQSLNLPNNNLNGSFEQTFNLLGSLQEVNLSGNQIKGVIINNIINLQKLQNLDLSNNLFSGPLPYGFSLLSNLRILNLSRNFFKEFLPIDFSSMSNLNVLNLANNNFTDSLANVIGNMKNLTSLQLQGNQFYGEIPSSIGALTALEELDLSFNYYYIEIPIQLSKCKKLIKLNLSYNKFYGTIPSQLGMLDQIEYLNLSNNNLSGCLADELLVWCSPKIVNGVEVFRSINLTNNYLLPWQGDFEMFCSIPQNQIGALCDNCKVNDGLDFIQPDCSCGTQLNPQNNIKGHVFIDYNANGLFDDSDFGFAGAPVELIIGCPGWTVLEITTTDAEGNYSFSGVPPGKYTVRVESGGVGAPQGYPSPKECCLSVDLCSDTSILECDMGYSRPDCTSNPYSVDNLCDVAYDNPLCNLTVIKEFACGQNPSVLGPWAGKEHCGGTYENTSFYGFIAGTGDYSIEFTIFSCAGTGVEYGLIDACNPDGPYIVCNGNANSGTVTVDASQLEPCKKYIFWMDGFSGSICSYYIRVVGDFNVCEVPAVQDIAINQACNLPCPNLATLPVTVVGANDIEDIDNVTLHWDILFNGAPIMSTTTIPVNDGMSLDVPFLEAGIYEICVVTEHPCPGLSAPFCKTFEFKSPNITSKEYNLCIDDFPWNGEVDSLTGLAALDEYGNPWKWSGGPIESSNINTTPPTYSFSSNYVDTCGCAYIQNIKFNILSSSQQRYDVCYKDLPFSIGDTLINTEVTSLPIYINNSQDTLSCDSIIYLSLQILSEGEPCDDKDASTINDVYDAACVCKGEKSNNVDNTSKDAWVVYPNPVTETLILSNTSTQFTIPDIEIYNIQGISIKPIIKENIGQQPKLELETTALPPGVYHLKIKTNQDMTIKRFVKI